MILDEKYFGTLQFRGETFKIIPTAHLGDTREGMTNARDAISPSFAKKLILKADELGPLKDNSKTVIVWKKQDGFYSGILISLLNNKKVITLITTSLVNNKATAIFNKEQNRIIIEEF